MKILAGFSIYFSKIRCLKVRQWYLYTWKVKLDCLYLSVHLFLHLFPCFNYFFFLLCFSIPGRLSISFDWECLWTTLCVSFSRKKNFLLITLCAGSVLSHFSHVQLFETPWTAGPSVHEILQVRILEWVASSLTQGSNLSLLWLLHSRVGSLPLAPLGKPLGLT